MKTEKIAVLRVTLEGMETPQLDAILLEELRKESPNGDLIRLISSVLKKRDMAPEIDANIQKAWERYQRKSLPVHKKPKRISNWLIKAAVVILVLFAVADIVPQEAKAMNFFERFIAWTEDVFSLVSPAEPKARNAGYVFCTDNPGLQEVYNQVTELGVTIPVVPMWLPEGYELVECKTEEIPGKTALHAGFSNFEKFIVYELAVYSDNITRNYYKDGINVRETEIDGTTYSIIRNNDLFIAVWTKENIECSIFIDCQEDILNRILESIYMMEVN